MRFLCAIVIAALAVARPAAQSGKFTGAPETFNARATISTAAGKGDAYLTIHVEKYTSDRDRQEMQRALETGGSAGFLAALRKAPVAGRFDVGKQTFDIRWARQAPSGSGRVITLVIDRPVYFVGAGMPGAKSREGFDLAIVQLTMDSAGIGEGTMAAAARVKPGGPTGVQVDNYATAPVKLVSVTRKIE
jgi:hypothetical protein